MNYGIIVKVLGSLLIFEAFMMVPSLLISLANKESDLQAFVISIIITLVASFILTRTESESKSIKVKDGLAIVAFGWVLVSFFGSLPFYVSGSIPSFIDAFFETVSGFTTTGATIINDIEILPKGVLFWRSFTHWIGGMGILVFTIALLPSIGVGGFQIFKAESPGPVTSRITPRIKDTAKLLYKTYIVITLVEIVLLLFGGMSLYDASVHTFGTLGTGGFSVRNSSIGAYNSTYIHLVIGFFMMLSGINFSLYYSLYNKKWREVFKDEEFKFYLKVISIATVLIGLNLYTTNYSSAGISLRDSFFQTSSIITTTGYATADFDLWPAFSKAILFVLMFIGGCAGSTGGGMKNIRILIMLKMIKRQILKTFHPRAVIPIKINNKTVTDETVTSISSFIMLYILLFIVGTILISLEGIGIESAASSVAATIGNIGPGFSLVGPTNTYSHFNFFSKLVLSAMMLLGRLEIFTLIALIAPRSWKNEV